MQAHPDTQIAQGFAQFKHAGLDRATAPEAGAVFDIDAIGAGVLGDDEQFFDAGIGEVFRFAQHVADRAADQIASHGGDDAEGATVVAAFGNFEIRVVPRGQADALWRHEIDEGVVRLGQMLMHHGHHFIGGVGAGDGEHFGVGVFDDVALGAQAPGDNHAAIFIERLADGIQGFFHRGVDKAAGVYHHQVGVLIAAGDFIPFGAKFGEDVLGVDGGFGAAERDEADGGCFGFHGAGRGDKRTRAGLSLTRRFADSPAPRMNDGTISQRLICLWLQNRLPRRRESPGMGIRKKYCGSGFRSVPAFAQTYFCSARDTSP